MRSESMKGMELPPSLLCPVNNEGLFFLILSRLAFLVNRAGREAL